MNKRIFELKVTKLEAAYMLMAVERSKKYIVEGIRANPLMKNTRSIEAWQCLDSVHNQLNEILNIAPKTEAGEKN